jgi:hypothetical protein
MIAGHGNLSSAMSMRVIIDFEWKKKGGIGREGIANGRGGSTFMILSTEYPFSAVSSGTIVSCTAPTARIHDCGGLIYYQHAPGNKDPGGDYNGSKLINRIIHAKIRNGKRSTCIFLGFQSCGEKILDGGVTFRLGLFCRGV